MKKLLIITAIAATLASCGDQESYRHYIAVTTPASGAYGAVYADQTSDSIVIETFDSYKCYASVDWISLTGNGEATIPNSYYLMYEIPIYVGFEANTTGEVRTGIVYINNYGTDWDVTASASFYQFAWLNVTYPTPTYTYNSYANPLTATFCLTDTAEQVVDSLAFTVYDDWTLTANADFVTPSVTSGQAGEHVVYLTLTQNEATDQREATLALTSRGVTTCVTLTQEAAAEEQE